MPHRHILLPCNYTSSGQELILTWHNLTIDILDIGIHYIKFSQVYHYFNTLTPIFSNEHKFIILPTPKVTQILNSPLFWEKDLNVGIVGDNFQLYSTLLKLNEMIIPLDVGDFTDRAHIKVYNSSYIELKNIPNIGDLISENNNGEKVIIGVSTNEGESWIYAYDHPLIYLPQIPIINISTNQLLLNNIKQNITLTFKGDITTQRDLTFSIASVVPNAMYYIGNKKVNVEFIGGQFVGVDDVQNRKRNYPLQYSFNQGNQFITSQFEILIGGMLVIHRVYPTYIDTFAHRNIYFEGNLINHYSLSYIH